MLEKPARRVANLIRKTTISPQNLRASVCVYVCRRTEDISINVTIIIIIIIIIIPLLPLHLTSYNYYNYYYYYYSPFPKPQFRINVNGFKQTLDRSFTVCRAEKVKQGEKETKHKSML